MRINSTTGLVTIAGLLAMAGLAAFPVAAQQNCPPRCGLDVELPEDVTQPPRIPDDQQQVFAVRGAVMLATLTDQFGDRDKAATKLVFQKAERGERGEPYTPFVDRPGPQGRPITEVRLNPNGPTRLFVRTDDEHECFKKDDEERAGEERAEEEKGCKYDIVNDGNPDRPILDPWIIIER